jgi:hypothetical protein
MMCGNRFTCITLAYKERLSSFALVCLWETITLEELDTLSDGSHSLEYNLFLSHGLHNKISSSCVPARSLSTQLGGIHRGVIM